MATLKLIGGSNTFFAYGYNGFLIYNFTGHLQSRMKHKNFEPPRFVQIGMGKGLEKFGDRYLYVNHEYGLTDFSDLQLYNELRLLTWLDPNSGDSVPFIQFPETSIFRNGKFFFQNSWNPLFTLADDLIYLVFGLEPVIYIFESSSPYSLVSEIPLNLLDYRYFKGADKFSSSDPRFFGQSQASGRILNIKKINGYFLIAYFPGFDASDTEEWFANKSPEEARDFRIRIQEKYPHRIAILDSLGNRLKDFVPEGLIASSMLLRSGELWMREKPHIEVERDYFRLFRVGLEFD